MSYANFLKVLLSSDPQFVGLSENDAHALFAAMLDSGVSDLELGAAIAAWSRKGETFEEALGFQRALSERLFTLDIHTERMRPIVLPAYGGGCEGPNLLPLLALLLQRLGIPVLVHGTLEGGRRVAASYVFRELGVLPCSNLRAAEVALQEERLAFVPTALVAPGLANLMALKGRLGVGGPAQFVAKLIQPFVGSATLVLGSSRPYRLEILAEVCAVTDAHALLLANHEGDPITAAEHRPRIEYLHDGHRETLFEEERGPDKPVHGLVSVPDAAATAAWIKSALTGRLPIPHPIVNQLACCLYASGYTDEMHQAKAIAAVETGGLAGVTSERDRAGHIEPTLNH